LKYDHSSFYISSCLSIDKYIFLSSTKSDELCHLIFRNSNVIISENVNYKGRIAKYLRKSCRLYEILFDYNISGFLLVRSASAGVKSQMNHEHEEIQEQPKTDEHLWQIRMEDAL